MLRPAFLAVVVALVAGCGNDRARPPDVRTPDAPKGTREVTVKSAGVRFTAPFNWPDLPALGKRAGGIQSKTATVAVWRYPRSEPLPGDDEALDEVEGLLVERVKKRNPSFELDRSSTGRLGGVRAIQLVGSQKIAGLPFGVRSAHLFTGGTEVVIDAYAPPGQFESLDASVFQPLLRSLEVRKR